MKRLLKWTLGIFIGVLFTITVTTLYIARPGSEETKVLTTNGLDDGMVTFIFDDGHKTFYDNAYPLFEEKGYDAAIAVDTLGQTLRRGDRMSWQNISEMEESGWEVMSHSVTHQRYDESSRIRVALELFLSKVQLEILGYEVNQYVAPMSTYPLDEHKDLLDRFYDASYTTYKNPKELPIEELVLDEFDTNEMYRVNMEGKSPEELINYVDFADKNDVWIVFYEHQIGGEDNYTKTETLSELLNYIDDIEIDVRTGSDAIEQLSKITNN